MKQLFYSLFIILSPISLINSALCQNNAPIQSGLENYIDPFTGDFNFQVPLSSISGPNGEYFPIMLQYTGSGTAMNQEASWVGLGWNLNIGEIHRNVNGVPDDYQAKKFTRTTYTNNDPNPNVKDTLKYYGPVYFKDYNYSSPDIYQTMDIYQSDRMAKVTENTFEFPDYDDFYVSGGNLSGKMSLALFDFASLFHKDGTDYDFGAVGDDYHKEFEKTPQFYFENEPATRVLAPYYSQTDYDQSIGYPNEFSFFDLQGSSCSSNSCFLAFQGPDRLKYNNPAYGQPYHITETEYYGDYLNSGNINRKKGIYYIDYYTNEQIYSHYGSSSIPNFIDHTGGLSQGTCNRNNSTYYDPKGIGMIRITDGSGLTYHYSLPVYAMNEIDRTFFIDDNMDIDDEIYTRLSRPDKYAITWKLVAITGPNYVDVNENNIPDEGDTGYWISFNYSKWSSDFLWRVPYAGYLFNEASQRFPGKYNGQISDFSYSSSGSTLEGETEQYYINWIKTSTQTLYFVKDIRLDGHSIKNSSGYATPKLCLKKVILINNEDLNTSWFETSSTEITSSDFSGLSTTAEDLTTVNWNQYVANKSTIDLYSLNATELDYDYSLCKKVYNNIKNTTPISEVKQSYTQMSVNYERFIVNDITGATTTTDLSNSGKLTLKEVKTYDYQHVSITPGYKFDYALDPADNPNYNHEQKDYYGMYKSNYDIDTKSGYITDLDKEHVDAWQLNKITLPLGAELYIEYESDEYSGVLYDFNNSKPGPVTRTFRINDVSNVGGDPIINVENEDLYNLTGGTITGGTLFYMGTACHNFSNGTLSGFIQNPTSSNNYKLLSGYSSACLTCTNCVGDNSPNSTAYVSIILNNAYGGGTRVKTISIKEPYTKELYSITTNYNEGISTAEPDPYGPPGYSINTLGTTFSNYDLRATKYSGDRHALPPAVGYSSVKFSHQGTGGNYLGSKQYNMINFFDTYTRNYVFGEKYEPSFSGDFDSYTRWEVISVTENKSLFGKLKSEFIYDNFNNLVARTEYKYSNSIIDKNESKTEEVFYRQFNTAKDVDGNNSDLEGITFHTVYYKIKVNSYLKEQITWFDGVKSSSKIISRDPLTGSTTESLEENNSVASSRKIQYGAYLNNSGMGSKYDNIQNQNLLFPSMSSKSKRNNTLIGGSYNLWSNSHDQLLFDNSEGRYKYTNNTILWSPYISFAFNGETDSLDWQRIGRTTLFGKRNQILENKDQSNFYTANKYGYNDLYMIAKASNSNYFSFTHTSFENTTLEGTGGGQKTYFDGEVFIGGGTKDDGSSASISPHTGDYLLKLTSGADDVIYSAEYNNTTVDGEVIEKGIQAGRRYRASVWVHSSSPSFAKLEIEYDDGTNVYSESIVKLNANGPTINDWTLMSVEIVLPDNFVGNGNGTDDFKISLINPGGGTTAYFDDLRFQAVDANVSAYVYDKKRGLILYYIDNDNFFTRLVYDAAGNVIEVYKETHLGEKKIASSSFHFVRE